MDFQTVSECIGVCYILKNPEVQLAENISNFVDLFLFFKCDPNLCVFAVWIETLDPQLPLIAFFATRDIKAGEELTFDYLMTTGESSSSSKSSSQSQLIPCYCGAANCRKYMQYIILINNVVHYLMKIVTNVMFMNYKVDINYL